MDFELNRIISGYLTIADSVYFCYVGVLFSDKLIFYGEGARNLLAQLQLCLDYEMLSWQVGKMEIPSGEFQDQTSSSLSEYPCSLELRQPAQERSYQRIMRNIKKMNSYAK